MRDRESGGGRDEGIIPGEMEGSGNVDDAADLGVVNVKVICAPSVTVSLSARRSKSPGGQDAAYSRRRAKGQAEWAPKRSQKSAKEKGRGKVEEGTSHHQSAAKEGLSTREDLGHPPLNQRRTRSQIEKEANPKSDPRKFGTSRMIPLLRGSKQP